ncbi:Alpha/Beta hydrolase protein [Calycina marina]|uniref:Alpha/Beta hydrolase protein n=1 Tax=Calycina marina TaxID=1763456 RepID=A0A9P8CCA1_9HELO|nr:Alpha/Beta hydrolase protein [Calycina marina]
MSKSSHSNAPIVSPHLTRPTVAPATVHQYKQQTEKLSFIPSDEDKVGSQTAVSARFIIPQDPVIALGNGVRLSVVPLAETEKLNALIDENSTVLQNGLHTTGPAKESASDGSGALEDPATIQKSGEGLLRRAMPPSRTHPLFPPLPVYGPSSLLRDVQCFFFQATSSVLSLAFLGIIVLGAVFTSIPLMFRHVWMRMTLRNPEKRRPYYEEEERRKKIRKEANKNWTKAKSQRNSRAKVGPEVKAVPTFEDFIPTEGGPDPLICDAGYYARRVGLELEEHKVRTEDGFIISLWHIYNPHEFTPLTPEEHGARGPDVFNDSHPSSPPKSSVTPKFPVLMIHGLLQSAGAYCTNDDESLAFYLCKEGYDVWIGNNRCGFNPEHTSLNYADPRMWAWNIRQMGVMDLPALTSRVLSETGFEKLGLVAHSQGTTQAFVALAKEQRPGFGDKLTVFCALAPAAYAGPLIGKAYFKFMRVISPGIFRIIFGIHAFIPFMMMMHATLPGKLYGAMGYRVFSFLFNWTDDRWDRSLRDRMFQFSPVYVSAESMRWWLGRECFAKQKCILATREEGHAEDEEDEMEEYYKKEAGKSVDEQREEKPQLYSIGKKKGEKKPKGSTAWYNGQVPPFALWVAGNDDLVDGRRLLRRFERGREPCVRVVHQKVIDEYEHLDVIWAVDSIEKVGKEVKETLWKTCNVRDKVRVPRGCQDIDAWVDNHGGRSKEAEDQNEQDSSSSGDEVEDVGDSGF